MRIPDAIFVLSFRQAKKVGTLLCCLLFAFVATAEAELINTAPSPAELVAAQPNYARLYSRIGKQQTVDFKPQLIRELNDRATRPSKVVKERHGRVSMGITGVMYQDLADAPFMPVVGLFPGTPAADVVKEGDIIVGVNGRLFESGEDPRVPMGYAIYEAQTAELGGRLTLAILRDERGLNVTVPLGITPRYSANWPFDCPRSQQTLDTTIRFVIDHTKANGDMSGRHTAKGGWWNSLLLLAVDDDAALEIVRRDLHQRTSDDTNWSAIEQMIRAGNYPTDPKPGGKASWRLGPELTALSEYYLLTGDSSVLPIIAHRSHWLELGQSPVSGSWCHGLGFGGYGEVNSAGLGCFLGLALASKTPVPMQGKPLLKSIDFFGKFASGGIPYGNHPPEAFRRSDNGRNGNAAVAFAVLGDHAKAQAFARPTCYTFAAREWGHAENAFSFLWGPLGASHAPEPEFRMFLDNQVWYYEMARVPYEGGGVLRSMRAGRFMEPYQAAGVLGLFMAMPQRRLQILGADMSVFAVEPPPGLREAAEAYKLKKWRFFLRETDAVLNTSKLPNEIAYAKQIRSAYDLLERNADYTLDRIRSNVESGQVAKAYYQLRALRLMLGGDREDMANLWAKLNAPSAQKQREQNESEYDNRRMEARRSLIAPIKEDNP